jgi:hypothetical protein
MTPSMVAIGSKSILKKTPEYICLLGKVHRAIRIDTGIHK